MKKRVCGIMTMCAFLCISPVNASATSFDNINEMLNKINGEDGFVEASECVIDQNTKSLHLSVVISENVPDDEVGTFASKVSGVLSEASQQDWYDYDYGLSCCNHYLCHGELFFCFFGILKPCC